MPASLHARSTACAPVLTHAFDHMQTPTRPRPATSHNLMTQQRNASTGSGSGQTTCLSEAEHQSKLP